MLQLTMKKCTKCFEEKIAALHFSLASRQCKDCIKKRAKKNYKYVARDPKWKWRSFSIGLKKPKDLDAI